jgi:ABC-type sugar transport system permease subunit
MKSNRVTPYIFLIVPLFLFCFVLVYPMIQNVYLSVTNWDGKSDPKFIGLENYAYFFVDPMTYVSLTNTLIWVALAMVLPVALGLIVAVMAEGAKGENIFKGIIFAPFALSGVVVGLVWRLLYEPSYGMFNTILRSMGLSSLALPWLGLPGINTYAMILASTWSAMPGSMVIFIAGLKSIPVDIIDAAKADGAKGWRLFRSITFPLLMPFTTVIVAMTILNTLKVFDIIYVMTTGGPYRSSETLAVTMFFDAFSLRQYGYGSAVGTILFAIIVVITIAYLHYSFKGELRY